MTGEALYELLLIASTIVFLVMLVIYARSGKASMFNPITVYLGFHLIVFVIRPYLAYYRGYTNIYSAYDFTPSMSDKIIVLLGTNLGLIVFVLAGLAFGRAQPTLGPIQQWQLDQYIKPVLITCLILGVPAVWSLTELLAVVTGRTESQFRLDFATGITVNTTSNGYFMEAQLMLATLTGMLAYVFRFRWWSLIPFMAFVILRAGTGGRGPFIAAIFFLMLLVLHQHGRRWMTFRTTTLAVAAFALFRIVGDYRATDVQWLQNLRPNSESGLRFLEGMDWANLEFYEYVVYVVPQRSGSYDYFMSLSQLFTEPIPRILWEDKPIGAPISFFNLFDYGFPIGITYSLPGAGWMALGWFGIIILCTAFAWVYGRAYNRFMRGVQTPFTVMLYSAFLITLIIAVRDGVFASIFRQSIFYVTPVLVMQLVAKAYGLGRLAGHGRVQPIQVALTPKVRRKALAETVGKSLTPKERRKMRATELGDDVSLA